MEKYLIIYYESYCSGIGYNVSLGGEEGFRLLPPWNKGKHLSKEHKDELSKSSLNRKDISKQVKCVETNIIYESAYEAARQTGLNPSHISACRNGKRLTCGGFHWIYVEHPVPEPETIE